MTLILFVKTDGQGLRWGRKVRDGGLRPSKVEDELSLKGGPTLLIHSEKRPFSQTAG